ncbi:CBS domain-containing protein [Streptomyces sp. JHA19]|uniref:CBS domain-containing protein n=1 Tax=Streptomyces sp. JHA19 TaxID=1577588 RepID=UPI0006E1D7F7|nr:CBS domain-containing protein [Streptomyces sp. JHA19]
MTTAQPQYQAAHRISGTGVDGRDTAGPRVRDDMTVEVALSLMAGARVDHLVLCDGDDQSTGTVTRERLAVLRGSPAYTDRIRLRDVHVLDTPVTPVTPVTGRCHRELGVAALAS